MRADNTYSDMAPKAKAYEGHRVDQPVAGFYRHKMRSGSVRGAVRIWYGRPLDPITGEMLDRSLRWQAHFLGEYIELDYVWPQCAGEPITEQEYQSYCARKDWAEVNAPQSAYAKVGRKYDPLDTASPLPF